jgi:hypothetical protein
MDAKGPGVALQLTAYETILATGLGFTEKRKSQSLPTLRGLESNQTPLLLPVAGTVFSLDPPLYRTG